MRDRKPTPSYVVEVIGSGEAVELSLVRKGSDLRRRWAHTRMGSIGLSERPPAADEEAGEKRKEEKRPDGDDHIPQAVRGE